MTTSSSTPDVFVGTDTDALQDAEHQNANSSLSSSLPRPVSSQPEIADTGRIRFGAAARIPSKK